MQASRQSSGVFAACSGLRDRSPPGRSTSSYSADCGSIASPPHSFAYGDLEPVRGRRVYETPEARVAPSRRLVRDRGSCRCEPVRIIGSERNGGDLVKRFSPVLRHRFSEGCQDEVADPPAIAN